MKQRWEAEKAAIAALRATKSEIEQLARSASSRPSARPTTARAAELKYGKRPRARGAA